MSYVRSVVGGCATERKEVEGGSWASSGAHDGVKSVQHVIASALRMTRPLQLPKLFHFKLMLHSCSGHREGLSSLMIFHPIVSFA